MKLLIVGLGSMGKRRARLTKGIDAAIQIVGVDTAESRRDEALRLGLADAAYTTIGEAVAAEHPTPRWSAPRRWPTRRSSASCWTTTCPSLPS